MILNLKVSKNVLCKYFLILVNSLSDKFAWEKILAFPHENSPGVETLHSHFFHESSPVGTLPPGTWITPQGNVVC